MAQRAVASVSYTHLDVYKRQRILRALATAGLIGNIVKTNASISGAEAGCQAEVGVACSMASAAANQLFGGSPAQIEYAAEMGALVFTMFPISPAVARARSMRVSLNSRLFCR